MWRKLSELNPTKLKMAASEKRSTSVDRQTNAVEHVDSVIKGEKLPEQDEKRDWTGTARKTDPEEIKLVRKLDYRIMVGKDNNAKCVLIY